MSNIRSLLMAEVHDLGFALPSRVLVDEMPDDVTVISSNEVMRLMTQLSSLIAYAASEEAIAKGEAEVEKGRFREQRAQKWIAFRASPKKMTVADMEAELDADPELVALQQSRILAENYARMVEALLRGYEQKYQLLSREVTRRGISAERHFD